MKKLTVSIIRGAGIIIASMATCANALAFETIPSTVEPGRVAQEITATKPKAKRTLFPALTAKQEPMKFPKEIAGIKFKLNSIVITGNTLYTSQQLLALFPHKVGTSVTLGEIQEFANNITLKYNNAGYVLSQAVIPAQVIQGGMIHIKVIEGYVHSITVKGDVSEKTKALIEQYGNKILNKKPLNINELESTLLLASDLPGIDVKSILTPSKNVTDAADLTLLVTHAYVDNNSYFDFDNRGTRYLGPTRTIAAMYVNTMLGGGASTGIRIAESGQWEEMHFVELEHKQYVGINGLMFDIDGQFTKTVPGFILEGTNTIGTNKYVLLGAQYPIFRHRSYNLHVNAAFNYVNSFMQQFNTKIYNDQIRTLQFGASYDFLDKYQGSNNITAVAMQGFNILGASQKYNFVSRIGAKPSFTKFTLSGGRLQGLFKSFSAMLTANGQYACNRMYAYEQIGYGGLPFGDAYDPSEIIGDRGIEAKLELRSDTSFPFSSVPSQYFVYADGGVLWNYDHINQKGRQTGTSAGFGVRSTAWQHANLSLELAKPLDRDVAATAAIPGGTENPRAWRGFFTITLFL